MMHFFKKNCRQAAWALPALLLGLLLVTAAAERPGARVGVVDADRIRAESRFVRQRLQEISRPAEEIKARLLAKRTEIQSAMAEYQAQASALSEEARKTKTLEIQRLQSESDVISREFTEALNLAESKDLEFIRTQIMGIVQTLAEERNLDSVLSNANILYVAPGSDLTGLVIERLDATLPR